MPYGLNKSELETSITYNEEDEFAEVYTCSPKVQKRLDTLVQKFPEDYILNWMDNWGDGTFGAGYKVRKKYIKFGAPRITTEEQREALLKRLSNAHAKKEEM